MFTIDPGMGNYSDQVILPVLVRLSKCGPLTLTEVSEKTGVPVATVRNSVNRMLEMGYIRRRGHGKRWGYIYECVRDCQTE